MPYADHREHPPKATPSPAGRTAEDGDGVNHLVGSTDLGEALFFARDDASDSERKAFFFAHNDASDSEFTGPTFSRNKKVLFANVRSPGITYAITGPFRKQR